MATPDTRPPTLDYRLLFDVAPVGVVYAHGDGTILDCNATAETMLGRTRDDLRDTHWRALSHPGELEQSVDLFEELRGGLRDHFEMDKRYVRPDGSVIWAHVSVSCTRDAHGQIRHLVSVLQDIDDRRRAERALRESEERFRTLVEQSLAGIYILRDDEFLYLNPRLEEVFGIEPGSDGVRPSDLVAPEDGARVREMIRRREDGETETARYGFTGRRVDGTFIQVEVHGSRATLDGEPVIVGMLMDVTDRARAERELALAKQQYETLLDTIPDPAWLKDADSRLLACNQALARMLGRPRDEMIGRSNGELLPPDVAERTALDDRSAIEAGGPVVVEEVMVEPDGEARLYETIKAPFRDLHGEWAGTAGIARDITDRNATEERLRLLSAAVEQSPAGTLVTETDGTIVYVNTRFCETTGYTREEALGQTPALLNSGYHDEAFYQELWGTIQSGQEWRGEVHNRRKDGSIVRELVGISPIHGPDGSITHYLAVKEDVTELRALEQRLLQSQKLEAIGQLAGGIAHDFNNMLTAISGFGELLRPDIDERSPSHAYLDQILRAAERSTRLTSQLLAFSRRQILKPERLDLSEVVREIEPMLSPLIGEAIRLVVDAADGPAPVVEADRAQIEQVLLNLVLNARDAMQDGGTLRMSTRWLPATNGEGARVELSVEDDGAGIPAEVADHIFDPFFTTKPVGRGTGLGLATVYGIVRQSGGEIDVQSTVGEGSRFQILLPAASVAEQPPADVAAEPAPEPASPMDAKVLVVEDEAPVRQLVCRVLEKEGYQVLRAANGEEALSLPETDTIDLLLTDVVMPGISGRELATRLHQARPDLPVLFMSGYTQDEVLRHGIQAGEVRLLEKPFTPAELLSAIHATLTGK